MILCKINDQIHDSASDQIDLPPNIADFLFDKFNFMNFNETVKFSAEADIAISLRAPQDGDEDVPGR